MVLSILPEHYIHPVISDFFHHVKFENFLDFKQFLFWLSHIVCYTAQTFLACVGKELLWLTGTPARGVFLCAHKISELYRHLTIHAGDVIGT